MNLLKIFFFGCAVIFSGAQELSAQQITAKGTMMNKRNVRDYGAKGDGKTLDTAAIQAAVDAGGMVYFPPGSYLTGTIYLGNASGLEISPGAEIVASGNLADYNKPDFIPQNSASKAENTSGGHLIVAVGKSDIVLCGGGRIRGNYQAFLNEPHPEHKKFFKVNLRPAQMLYFCESKNIRISDLEIQDSPYWHLFILGCENVMIRGIHINGDPRVINNDGIDIDCCRNVTISDCIIETADDAIAIRGNATRLSKKMICENLIVSNCILRSHFANTIRIGVGSSEIRNGIFSNLILLGYRTGVSIVSCWNRSKNGANIHDIEFKDIRSFARRPFSIQLNNTAGEDEAECFIRNIRFSGFSGTGELSSIISGNGRGELSGLQFENINFTYSGIGKAPDTDANGAWGHSSTDAVFELSNCANIDFNNVRIDYAEGITGWRTECEKNDSRNVRFTNCTFSLIEKQNNNRK